MGFAWGVRFKNIVAIGTIFNYMDISREDLSIDDLPEVDQTTTKAVETKEPTLSVVEWLVTLNQKQLERQAKEIAEKEGKLAAATNRVVTNFQKLKQRYLESSKVSKNKLTKVFQEQYDQLLAHPLLELIVLDAKKRIIFTTKEIFIKKRGWLRKRKAGVYQIRVDFEESFINQMVRIINITQTGNDYDSPTVQNGEPCWGNIEEDIRQDVKDLNLLETGIDLINYITSTNDESGYCDWEDFFADTKKRAKDFNFEEWDKERNSDHSYSNLVTYLTTASISRASFAPPMSPPYLYGTTVLNYGEYQTELNYAQAQQAAQQQELNSILQQSLNQNPNFTNWTRNDLSGMNPRQVQHIKAMLERLGLRVEAAEVYANQIFQSFSRVTNLGDNIICLELNSASSNRANLTASCNGGYSYTFLMQRANFTDEMQPIVTNPGYHHREEDVFST